MDNLSPYDLKILKFINQFDDGISQKELINKFGEEALDALDGMNNKFISQKTLPEDYENMPPYLLLPFPTGNWTISDDGKLYLKRIKSMHALKSKEKWEERLWGFVSGAIVGIIIGYFI